MKIILKNRFIVNGNINIECGAGIWISLGFYETVMILHDLFADCQSDACAFILVS